MSSNQSTSSMRRALGLVVAAVALVGACSSSATAVPAASSGVAGVTSAPSVAASTAPQASAEAGASGSGQAYTVAVSTKSGVGSFLTGEDGKTLYTFKKDSANTSNCAGGCATAWPPFTLDAGETVVAGAGVTVTLGTTKRPDGSTQVTADGMPLYYFAKDSAAGDTNGQGVGGVWFVASPTGAGAASPAASGGVSY